MLRAKDIRSANKNVVDWGRWQNGNMSAAIFPLSRRRGRSYRLGAAYRWRLIRFEAAGNAFRLLLAFSLEKEQYRAMLALEGDRDMRVIASYEFHGTHPGWHLSAACGDIYAIPEGVMVGPWQRRLPRASSFQRSARLPFFVVDDDTALDAAARFFRLHKAEGALL